MKERGYAEAVATIPMRRVNSMIVGFAIPVVIFMVLVFRQHWSDPATEWQVPWQAWPNPARVVLLGSAIIVSLVFHELIHVLIWSRSGKAGWRGVTFGVDWRHLRPYAHDQEPVSVGRHLLGLVAPLVILGLIPCGYSMLFGDDLIMVIAVVNIVASVPDVATAVLLDGHRGAVILDHPTECGFIAFTKCPSPSLRVQESSTSPVIRCE